MSRHPKPALITLDQVPLVLSEWRRLRTSHLLSDRQLYAAAETAWNAVCEMRQGGQGPDETAWGERVKR